MLPFTPRSQLVTPYLQDIGEAVLKKVTIAVANEIDSRLAEIWTHRYILRDAIEELAG